MFPEMATSSFRAHRCKWRTGQLSRSKGKSKSWPSAQVMSTPRARLYVNLHRDRFSAFVDG